ncbi:MAG: WYL domain-containing protein [Oscillospiraceae bacterium]|nr:WYL domain-containing protein [Oscillospiraceae bacterium]
MYQPNSKKAAILCIVEILKKYTDSEHTMTQKQIQDKLETEYGLKLDRKAVKRNLTDLADMGFDVGYSERIRKTKSGEEETVLSDWYIIRTFDDSELRLLIDSILFSKYIPYSQCRELIEKLEKQSNRYFSAKVRHVRNLPVTMPANKELFYTIDVLDEAIEQGKKVKFHYSDFNLKLKREKRIHHGEPAEYIVNPYQMVATNGRYYLICNYDKYDNISHYRVDRIIDIEILDEPVKPMKNVTGYKNGLDLPKHVAEHIYMFCGESVNAKFRADRFIVNDIVDWFGTGVKFSNETDKTVDVSVKVNEMAMFHWAMQYGTHVEILEPESLRSKVAEAVKGMNEKYNG